MKERKSQVLFFFIFKFKKKNCVHLHGFHIIVVALSFDYFYPPGRIDDASKTCLIFFFFFWFKNQVTGGWSYLIIKITDV